MRVQHRAAGTAIDARTNLLVRGERPRIALVAHDISSQGGMQRVCSELLRRAACCVDFVVVSRTLSDELRGLVEWRRVPIVARPKPLRFVMFFVVAALRIRRAHVDLVHTLGAIVPGRVDVASVHFCHAGFRGRTGRLAPGGASLARRINATVAHGLALMAERWCYRPGRARALAAVSPGVAEELAQHYPGVPASITPNGVDVDKFAPSPANRAAMRQREGITGAEVVVLFVGGDWHRKGLALALCAIAAAQRLTAQRLFLWIVGRGDEKGFHALAQELEIRDRVRFFGVRSDAERFYQSADIFIFPTMYEAFPLVALEAAACALPLVGTRVSGVENLVGADEAGLLVERTPEAIGAAVARLADDPALRARLGDTGRQRAKAYSWESSVESVLALYGELLVETRSQQGFRG